MNYIKKILLFFCVLIFLSLTAEVVGAKSRPIYMPVDDLLFEVPNFTNAPSLDLNTALLGTSGVVFGDPSDDPERKTKEQKLQELIDVLLIAEPEDEFWQFYPYANGFFFYWESW